MQWPHQASCSISYMSPLLLQTTQAPMQHSTSGQQPNQDPHPPLMPGRSEAGPTMCSTSRAVYLLIASLTIAHNNQLRHCQRNTHSWHHARREVRAGCSIFSFLLIHRREEYVLKPFDFPIIHVEQPQMLQTWCYLAILHSSVPGNIWEDNLQGKALPQLLHHSLTSRLLLLGSLVWHRHCDNRTTAPFPVSQKTAAIN